MPVLEPNEDKAGEGKYGEPQPKVGAPALGAPQAPGNPDQNDAYDDKGQAKHHIARSNLTSRRPVISRRCKGKKDPSWDQHHAGH
jgi:hypothetical protein